jgi:probable HAF family extracellular repeat protein
MSATMKNQVRSAVSKSPAAAALLAAGLACSAGAQTITNIGVTPGGSMSGASSVSGNGAVVSATVDMATAHRWTGSGLTGLGTLPGAAAASADDLSFDGSVVVGSAFFVSPEETARAYRWTSSGGMQDLGVLPGGFASFGSGVSGDGSVVTGGSLDANFVALAFRWTSSGGMQSLGTLPGGTTSEGRRVSRDGSTIVGVGDTPQGNRAFAWTAGGGMQSLGLAAPTDGYSGAYGVNADGSVVAGFSGANATIWTNGVAQSLGTLPGDTNAIAYALNGDGSLVGGYSFAGSSPRATLWSASLGLVDLNTYLPTLGFDLTGWTLGYTRGISFDGTTIVGDGMYDGEFRGWVVTIPTPGAAGVLAMAGVVAMRRRRV